MSRDGIADDGMNPVGADRGVRLDVKHTPGRAHELKVDALSALGYADAAMIEAHRFLGQGALARILAGPRGARHSKARRT